MSTLHHLVRMGNDIERFRELLRAGINPNTRNNDGDTSLHLAASKNESNPQDIKVNLQLTRELIDFGADVNATNCWGQTPLIIAVVYRNCRMVKFLLEAYALIDEKDYDGNTALHSSCTLCSTSNWRRVGFVLDPDIKIVKRLLKFQPEIDVKNNFGQTPLMLAVKMQDLQIVKELLNHNASVNIQDSYEESALHHALSLEEVNVNIVLELVRYGSDFQIRNAYGDTPMMLYIQKRFNSSSAEVEKAKSVFKLFLFGKNVFSSNELMSIKQLSKAKNCNLSGFIVLCENEISQMQLDEIAPNCSIYDMAMRGFSHSVFENTHVPFDVFDKALDKLLEGHYPVFCDLIVSGICSPYLNKKFTEACCWVENTGTEFLNFDELYSLSFYLSHFDMLNMILACSSHSKNCKCFSCLERCRSQRHSWCSVL